VTSAGEVRTCCINETSFGNLFETEFPAIWNGEAYTFFRQMHARKEETPTGCANCIRNGRVRHSPFYAPLQAVTYRPIASPGETRGVSSGIAIEWPPDGATVTDPLVVTGSVPPDFSGEIVIDRAFPVPLRSVSVVKNREFIAVIDLPFVTEGSHLVGLRTVPGGEITSERTIHLWRPRAAEGETRVSGLAGRLMILKRPPLRPSVRVQGFGTLASTWLSERFENRWRVAVTFDVTFLNVGNHSVEMRPRWRGHAFRMFRLPDSTPGQLASTASVPAPVPSHVAALSS